MMGVRHGSRKYPYIPINYIEDGWKFEGVWSHKPKKLYWGMGGYGYFVEQYNKTWVFIML